MSKVKENRLRRMADRQGLRLLKSRRRDPMAIDYGRYALVDLETNGTVHADLVNSIYALTLDEVEEWLEEIAGDPDDMRPMRETRNWPPARSS